jgi:ferredoxin-NADP reductase
MQEFTTKVLEIKTLTQKVVEISLEVLEPKPFNFLAGQYVDFVIENQVRAYSMANVPGLKTPLTFCIEKIPGGLSTTFLETVKVGDEVKIQGPQGTFTAEKPSQNLAFIATGVGIAPFASIIPNILSNGFEAQCELLFCVRNEDSIFYFDKFKNIASFYGNFKFTSMLSQPKGIWRGETGRVTTYLEVNYERLKGFVFYICGGGQMVKDVREILLKKGTSFRDIKTEIFS